MGCAASTPESKSNRSAKLEKKSLDRRFSREKKEKVPDPGLYDDYVAVKLLGHGGTGYTWHYKDRKTGEDLAIKLMKRPQPKITQPNIEREIRIQADIGEGHPNIIKARAALLTEKHLALVLEYAPKGSLTDYVADRWETAKKSGIFMAEEEARYLFRQFINAVEFLHTHHIVHRDLKLDNTLLSGDDPPIIKLCDFGFARDYQENIPLNTRIGTPVYMSPEIINPLTKSYEGTAVDIWAGGVLLIVMMLGCFPYDHEKNPDPNTLEAAYEVRTKQLTQYRKLAQMRHRITKLSEELLDLLDHILAPVKERISLADIKQHPWYLMPLSPEHQAAEARLRSLQSQLHEQAVACDLSQSLMEKRNSQIRAMVAEACKRNKNRGKPLVKPLSSVDLTVQAVSMPSAPRDPARQAPKEAAPCNLAQQASNEAGPRDSARQASEEATACDPAQQGSKGAAPRDTAQQASREAAPRNPPQHALRKAAPRDPVQQAAREAALTHSV